MDAELSGRIGEENPDAVLAVAPDGRVLYWNRAAENIFGYSAADAVGQPLGALIIPPDRLEEEQRTFRDAATQDLVVYESVRRRKDGSLVHVSVSTKPVHDAAGRLSFLLTT
jgi:protein-histidine pros-kinase